MDFMLWLDSLIYPHDTFAAERDHAYFGHSVRNVLLAGLIYGGITGIIYSLFPSIKGDVLVEAFKNISGKYFLLLDIFFSPIIFLILLLLLSFLIYLSARIFKGYGDFITQTYLFSMIMSALILFSVLHVVPFIGDMMVLLLFVYSVKPLLVLLKITHKYGAKEAFLTFLLSAVFFAIFSLVVILLLWQTGIFVLFDEKTNAVGFRNLVIQSQGISYKYQDFEFSISNTLEEGVIVSNAIPNGDCVSGVVDFDKQTEKIESFVSIDSGKSTDVKIFNCSKKYFARGKFYVPLKFAYREKIMGESANRLETGILEGLTE